MLPELNTAFKGLEFEKESHTYTLDGQNLSPVSNIIKKFYEEFETEKQALAYSQRHGLVYEDVLEAWESNRKRAADFGTSVHDFGERYFYDKLLQPSNNHELAVINFWKSLDSNIYPLCSELRVFNKKYLFGGTIDNLFYHWSKTGIIISDYKTNGDIHKNFKGKCMLPPFQFLLDTPLSHYIIQLNTYQIALEDMGFNVIDRWVVWLHDDGTFENIEIPDYTNLLRVNY